MKLINLKIILMDHCNISNSVQHHTVSILVGDSENRLIKVKQLWYVNINMKKHNYLLFTFNF